MTTPIEIPPAVRDCFLPGTGFVNVQNRVAVSEEGAVRFSFIAEIDDEPTGLSSHNLPLLAIPEGASSVAPESASRVVVAVEGRDEMMADALAALLDPERSLISLIHVTWVPSIAGSPLDTGGIDDPEPSDLLAYEGAREALIGTATELRSFGFNVSAHLREARDPSQAIANLIVDRQPAMFALGLGRHGAGIGRRVMERVRVPTLFVRAR